MKPSRLILMLQHQMNCGMLVIVFLFSLFVLQVDAQEPVDSTKLHADTTSQEINTPPIDTDSSRFEKQKQRIESSTEFYASVKRRAGKNFFSKQLYPLLFRKPPSAIMPDNQIDLPANIPFVKHKGKPIRSIKLFKVDVFGSSVLDTNVNSQFWLDKSLNSIHFKTQDAVIRSYLQVKKGDHLDPLKLADNERLIRQSALFEDARFIVTEINGSDSVDLLLIVKDVFPLGFDVRVNSAERSSFRWFNRNIMGFGHQIEQSVEFNSKEKTAFFFNEGAYKARNILHSFTDAKLYWQTRPDIRRLGFEITKPFLTPETRYGGGFNIQRTNTWLLPDVRIPSLSLIFNSLDLWGGYSVIINRFKSPSPLRSQAAITMRYYSINYIKSPSLLITPDNPMISLNRYIAGLSLVKSGYYRSNMVFGYGKTEDIPYGHLAELIGGYETSLLAKRYYTGIRLVAGAHMAKTGYLNSSFQLGGFWKNKQIYDGTAILGFNYISRLLKSGSLKVRNYVTFNYTTGINRQSPERLLLNNPDGTNILRNYTIEGSKRLSAYVESVIFTPYYLLGFRFAAYAFTKAAMVGVSGRTILKQAVYPAIGMGIRLKNENLIFSTFQLGFTWYVRPDNNGRNLLFEFTDLPQVDESKFSINAPEFTLFR